MQTLSEIRTLLNERGLRPRRSLGQNFLVDHNLLKQLVDASGAGDNDLVLEVGPGTGTMTEEILDRGCRVIACELDTDLCSLLRDHFETRPNFTLIEGDCLASKRSLSPVLIEALGDEPFRLVANLPYGAGTPLLLALMTQHPACESVHVTLQKEVGERLLAEPGTDAYGSISIIAQVSMDLRCVKTLDPGCFWPRPKVDSMMVSGQRKQTNEIDLVKLAQMCQTLFTQRRKQVGRACANLGLTLPEGIDPSMRVNELSAEVAIGLSLAQSV